MPRCGHFHGILAKVFYGFLALSCSLVKTAWTSAVLPPKACVRRAFETFGTYVHQFLPFTAPLPLQVLIAAAYTLLAIAWWFALLVKPSWLL